MNPNTDQIFRLKKSGFALFPLAENTKVPLAGLAWKEWAEQADEATVYETLIAHPEYNWAVFLGASGHCAVDLDGEAGMSNWEKICNGTPPTMTVSTPRGGKHLYFKGSLPPTQSKLAPSIDTRGENSYVVAPGSVIDGKMYEILDGREPVEAPDLLFELMRSAEGAKPHPAPPVQSFIPQNSPDQVEEAIRMLATETPCVEGSDHGGEHLYAVFCKVRDIGISQDMAGALVSGTYNPRCEPPWDMADPEHREHFYKKLQNAYRYAKNQPGVASPEARLYQAKADFIRLPLHKKLNVTPGGQLMQKIEKENYIIDGLAAPGTVTVLGGAAGQGKSLFALTACVAAATGRQNLLGERFKIKTPVRTAYIDQEDVSNTNAKRLRALGIRYEIPPAEMDNVQVVKPEDSRKLILVDAVRGVPIINEEGIAATKDLILEHHIELLSIAPLSGLTTGNDSDNAMMRKFMNALQDIAMELHCAVITIHHTSKAAANRNTRDGIGLMGMFRGASSIIDASRLAWLLLTPETEDLRKAGLTGEGHNHFYLAQAKNNMAPYTDKVQVYRKDNIDVTMEEYAPVMSNVEGEFKLKGLRMVRLEKEVQEKADLEPVEYTHEEVLKREMTVDLLAELCPVELELRKLKQLPDLTPEEQRDRRKLMSYLHSIPGFNTMFDVEQKPGKSTTLVNKHGRALKGLL